MTSFTFLSILDLVELVLFRAIKSKASLAEVRTYLFNRATTYDPNQMVYSDSQVVRAEQRFCLTRKASLTTAKECDKLINIIKRHNYWTQPYPHGTADIDTDDMIDIDECGIFVKTSNRKFGKTFLGKRCSQEGVYKRGRKLNLLLGISADQNYPSRWINTWTEGCTTIKKYAEFIQEVLDDLEARHHGRPFCLTKENLNTHKNPLIEGIVFGAGHKIVYRAPYYAVYGSIEYVLTLFTHCCRFFVMKLMIWAISNIKLTRLLHPLTHLALTLFMLAFFKIVN